MLENSQKGKRKLRNEEVSKICGFLKYCIFPLTPKFLKGNLFLREVNL